MRDRPFLNIQCVNSVFMVRPARFGFNPDAAESNLFMHSDDILPEELSSHALKEFDELVSVLRAAGVRVVVFQDIPEPFTPDAIFPNNWFDSDRDGMVLLYPMQPKNRRPEHEKGRGYVSRLQEEEGFYLNRIVDLTPFEFQGKFLEGTGSMVFDCVNKMAYATLSERTHGELLNVFSEITGYDVFSFHAVDRGGHPIYHTNVVMSVGDAFAVVCLESVADLIERAKLRLSLENTGHEIIDISYDQMERFAGNILELMSSSGESLLAMSESARRAFTPEQKKVLEGYATLVSSPIPTIEKYGGGSVRCMLAEIFLGSLTPFSHG